MNEENTIIPLVERIHKTFTSADIVYELIFVDDLSTDTTRRVISRLKNKYPIKLLLKRSEKERGKWKSIFMGIRQSAYDTVGFIDADLQYPPEKLPDMLRQLKNNGVVVARRKHYAGSIVRKIASSIDSFLFGKILYRMPYDIQSGMKVFRKHIALEIEESSISPWATDLVLLVTARDLGYSIGSVDILFEKRKSGKSKVNIITVTGHIVLNYLKLKLRSSKVYQVHSNKSGSMIGMGYRHKGTDYITHSSLPHSSSAIITLTKTQQLFIAVLLLAFLFGLVRDIRLTFTIIVAFLSFLYFADVLFNLWLVLKSLYFPPEIVVGETEITSLQNKDLPVYTILCPLYREAHVIPQFIDSINRLDWPKNRLDVKLLLEEDDADTMKAIRHMDLPSYMEVLTVPEGKPKTKPKACNWGLSHAKGEYVVIYDAEDKPEPDQLKKAYYTFKHLDPTIACLQAKLNYYNPHHNLLTRFFTAEYSLWFDVILTGLQNANTSIPLGGTSNHFRTHEILSLHGWDPFNVTEDCDLGARLFKNGYKTAIIDSTTYEEANSHLGNWIRQRSRWIKGYIQTYFVHMRSPWTFIKNHGVHALMFQMVVGGKIAFILINPILWIVTISYFILYRYVGEAIESVYPTWVFYMAATSMVFGNFLCMYYYMIGCAKRGQYAIIKYVFLVPFYWLLVSISAIKSVIQLIIKPYYWEKTHHGLHIKHIKNSEALSEKKQIFQQKAWRFTGSTLGGASMLIAASGIANVINFALSAYLTRSISFEAFGLIALVNNVWALADIPIGSIGRTVSYRSAFIFGKYGVYAASFWRIVRKRLLYITLGVSFLWAILIPYSSRFFQTGSAIPFLFFTPVWIIATLSSVDMGLLSGSHKFALIAAIIVIESISKFLYAVILVSTGFIHDVYIAIPLSMATSFMVGWFAVKRLARSITADTQSYNLRFPKWFLGTTVMQDVSTVVFFSLDVILAKHYLPPKEAGQYALLSIIGKIILFIGSAFAQFFNPVISKAEGLGRGTWHIFIKLLGISTAASMVAYLVIGVYGEYTAPLLFGPKALPILEYLPTYAAAILIFSISRNMIIYQQIKKRHIIPITALLFAGAQLYLLTIHHGSIAEFVNIQFAISIALIIGIIFMSTLSIILDTIESNYEDITGLFKPMAIQPSGSGSKTILIYNWRDIHHAWAGGAEVYIHELAKRWVAMGHTVIVFSARSLKNPSHEIIDGVHLMRHGHVFSVYIWAWLYYLTHFKKTADVIIDSENGIPFFTPLYSKQKIFLLIHHVHQRVFRTSLTPPFSWIATFLEGKLMPYIYRKVKVITVSPSSKADIIDHNLTDTDPSIIYCGVDNTLYTPGIKSKIPLVAYVGRLKSYKSLHVFIRAALEILKHIPTVRFIIAGNGEEKRRLMELADRLNIEKYIDFVGTVTNEEKIRIYQKAWVFVNPSLMEGWGITSIEANACGTPVVASNVSGLRDSVYNPHSGFLVPYGNHEEFAKHITLLLKNPALRQRMSREATKWASKFEWDKSASQFLNLIDKSNRSGTCI